MTKAERALRIFDRWWRHEAKLQEQRRVTEEIRHLLGLDEMTPEQRVELLREIQRRRGLTD